MHCVSARRAGLVQLSQQENVTKIASLCYPHYSGQMPKIANKYFLPSRCAEKPGISRVTSGMGWKQLSTIPVDNHVH